MASGGKLAIAALGAGLFALALPGTVRAQLDTGIDSAPRMADAYEVCLEGGDDAGTCSCAVNFYQETLPANRRPIAWDLFLEASGGEIDFAAIAERNGMTLEELVAYIREEFAPIMHEMSAACDVPRPAQQGDGGNGETGAKPAAP